ncbi:uncharacterized protein LOC142104314 [Mixophyes fleayi]|uniref:uncharacterized protein LOC142104314 n=1 Tax=Mixophyes fleayi TaxID=3061075 RepID=UPI003F4DED86
MAKRSVSAAQTLMSEISLKERVVETLSNKNGDSGSPSLSAIKHLSFHGSDYNEMENRRRSLNLTEESNMSLSAAWGRVLPVTRDRRLKDPCPCPASYYVNSGRGTALRTEANEYWSFPNRRRLLNLIEENDSNLRDVEKELDLMKHTLETSITSLDHLVSQMKINKPAQAPTTMKGKSLSYLMEEFYRKLDELETAVKSKFISIPPKSHFINEPPKPFRAVDLYYLIQHVENNDWIHLMRVLNMSNAEMETCRIMSSDVREQKYQMILFWLSKDQVGIRNRTNELIFALEVIDYGHLASIFRFGCTRSEPSLYIK